jgi:hypothetical protein
MQKPHDSQHESSVRDRSEFFAGSVRLLVNRWRLNVMLAVYNNVGHYGIRINAEHDTLNLGSCSCL